MIKYSKDGKVKFESEQHIYTLLEEQRQLTGITTLIDNYIQPFNSDRIAEEYAKRRDLKKDEVLADWKEKGEISRENGTIVHKIIENYFKTGLLENTENTKGQQAIQFIKNFFITERLIPIEVEYIVYNKRFASQIDLIAKNKKDEYFIFDWKTSKEINKFSYKDRRMLYPFNKYMDCNFYHYSLQIEFYKRLYTEQNIKQGFIIQLGEEKYTIYKAEKIIIPDYILN